MKEYKYTIDGNKYEVAINEVNDTTAKVTVNGTEYNVEWEKPAEEKPVVKVQPVVAKPAATTVAAAPAAATTAAITLIRIITTIQKVTAAAPKAIVPSVTMRKLIFLVLEK